MSRSSRIQMSQSRSAQVLGLGYGHGDIDGDHHDDDARGHNAQRGRVVDVREARESQPRQILGIAESSSCCSALIVPKDCRQDGLATSESDIARLAFCWWSEGCFSRSTAFKFFVPFRSNKDRAARSCGSCQPGL